MKISQQLSAKTKTGKHIHNKSFLAEILGISRKTFYKRLRKNNFSADEIKTLKRFKIIN